MGTIRLDGFLSRAAGVTRSAAQRLIKAGRVTLNGVVVREAATRVGEAQIALDGETVSLPQPVYIMLHKPAGYLCANTDGQHPTVLDLLPAKLHPTEPLQIVGRLDLDTTGLLLLTTDGAWNHRITSPGSRCSKIYRATLAEPISSEAIQQLEHGIMLHSETRPTLPCAVQIISPREICMTLQEGRYHQVKRMIAAVGNRVVFLHREQIGSLRLGTLLPGQFRHLTAAEVAEL